MQIMQNFLSFLILAAYIGIGFPCALPYWWSEQYHFPPFYPSGQPKSTYKYRETFHQSDPNNYVRVQEYSDYTWWEHDTTKNHVQNVPNHIFPQADFGQDINNVVFSNDGRFHVFYPHNRHGVKGGVPHSDTNNIVPRGDNIPVNTNNMIPSDKTDRISPPSDTNNIVPATDSTSKPTTTTMTTTTTTSTTTVSELNSGERERNENENFEQVTRIGNIENDLETGASSKLQENKNFLSGWFGTKNTNKTEPCKVSETDIHSLRSMIEKMFSLPREHRMHADTKEKAREDILNKFRDLGLQVWTQNFTTPPIKNEENVH